MRNRLARKMAAEMREARTQTSKAPTQDNLLVYFPILCHCAFCEESTKLTGCVDFDTSMNIRYGATCEINMESQKFEISDILIYISVTEKKKVKISRKLTVEMSCMT